MWNFFWMTSTLKCPNIQNWDLMNNYLVSAWRHFTWNTHWSGWCVESLRGGQRLRATSCMLTKNNYWWCILNGAKDTETYKQIGYEFIRYDCITILQSRHQRQLQNNYSKVGTWRIDVNYTQQGPSKGLTIFSKEWWNRFWRQNTT